MGSDIKARKTRQAFCPQRSKGAEFEVQACLHNINVRSHANGGGRNTAHGGGADQSARVTVAEIVVVVLDKAGEPVQESVFTADADRIAGLREADCGGSGRSEGLKTEVTFHPCATGLHVNEKAVPGMAGAAGNGGQRLKLDLVRKSEGHCCGDAVDNAAIDAHPIIIGLDAGHKATGLIIAAGLRAAQRAARSVASEISEN